MANQQALLAELEKQLSALEGQIAEVAKSADGGEGDGGDKGGIAKVTIKRFVPKAEREAVAKKKKAKADDSSDDDSYDSDEDFDGDEDEDMDKNDKSTKKAAPEADVAKAADQKKADVAKGADETVTIEGQVIAKSVVGEAQFAVFKGMADKLEKAQTEIAKERDLRENAEFCKRADDVYKHVPGSTQERADMLKAISKMPEALQKSFEAVLTQSEKLAKSAFETIGTMVSKQDKDASETFEKSVSEIRKRDNCTRAEALQKARKENPEGFKAYQQAGN